MRNLRNSLAAAAAVALVVAASSCSRRRACPEEVSELTSTTRRAFATYRSWAERPAERPSCGRAREEYRGLGDSIEEALRELDLWAAERTRRDWSARIGRFESQIESARSAPFSSQEDPAAPTFPETDLSEPALPETGAYTPAFQERGHAGPPSNKPTETAEKGEENDRGTSGGD